MALVDVLARSLADGDALRPAPSLLPGPRSATPTSSRILDAVVEEVAARGFADLTIDAVARRAGVNRVTVYRHFGDREALLSAMVMREGRRVVAEVAAAMSVSEDPAEQLVEAIVTAVRRVTGHPVVRRTVRRDPAQMLAAVRSDDAALLRLGGQVMAQVVRRAQARGLAGHVDADEAGETLCRLLAAFVLLPPTRLLDVDDPEAIRAYARRTLVPMVLGPG